MGRNIYNIKLFSPLLKRREKTRVVLEKKMIGIAMVSERDFDNVTCVCSCNVYAL